MLDYGYRSRCCLAPLRLGKKKTTTGLLKKVWVCTKCRKSGVDIISLEDMQYQGERKRNFAEEEPKEVLDFD